MPLNIFKKYLPPLRTAFRAFLILAVALYANGLALVSAQVMSSSSYQIQSDSVNFAGNRSTSNSYISEDTVGEVGTGFSSSNSYTLSAGYQAMAMDSHAPSVPAGLSATAISTSEINLSWLASTDDTAVLAYRIYRDNLHIASTTSLTYADTGLTAETTYGYTVAAVDTHYNISARSATSSATTLADTITTPPSTPPGGGGGIVPVERPPQFLSLKVHPDMEEALVLWETDKSTISKISWGKTATYELGSITGEEYLTKHSALLKTLEANTLYHYKIEITDSSALGNIARGQFRTVKEYRKYTPPNVLDFKATARERDIRLTWQYPTSDIDEVRIMRSETFYPADISDGSLIYQGGATEFDDLNVRTDTTYYYTAFSRDEDGNYGSGVIARARMLRPGEPPLEPEGPFEGVPVAPTVHPKILNLTLADFDFIQQGVKIVPVGDRIAINGTLNLTVSLDYEKVPEILKTLGVTLKDPDDSEKVFTFLLRVNKEKTAYVATIGSLGKSGNYQLLIDILDYQNQGLKKLSGLLVANVLGGFEGLPRGQWWALMIAWNWLWLLLLLLLALYIYERLLKQRKDEI